MPWTKGQSGNPRGRPKGPTVAGELRRLLSRRYGSESMRRQAARRLLEIWLNSDDEQAAIRAANLVMQHVDGKPADQVNLDVEARKPMKVRLVWSEDQDQEGHANR